MKRMIHVTTAGMDAFSVLALSPGVAPLAGGRSRAILFRGHRADDGCSALVSGQECNRRGAAGERRCGVMEHGQSTMLRSAVVVALRAVTIGGIA